MKKILLVICLAFLLVSVSFASAGWFDTITGQATTEITEGTVTCVFKNTNITQTCSPIMAGATVLDKRCTAEPKCVGGVCKKQTIKCSFDITIDDFLNYNREDLTVYNTCSSKRWLSLYNFKKSTKLNFDCNNVEVGWTRVFGPATKGTTLTVNREDGTIVTSCKTKQNVVNKTYCKLKVSGKKGETLTFKTTCSDGRAVSAAYVIGEDGSYYGNRLDGDFPTINC